MWQALYEELGDQGFMVIAVAMDSREGDALPWIEAARPTYVTLIDRNHRLAELYHLVNVPQAAWIDERGRIVRPAEPAGAYEGFRKMNRATREMPDDVARLRRSPRTSTPSGTGCGGVPRARTPWRRVTRARLPLPTEETVRAHAMFRLGQLLLRRGEAAEGDRWLEAASRHHPGSWCIWRQRAGATELGLAALPDFWTRVDALGDKRYYARIDMPGMP